MKIPLLPKHLGKRLVALFSGSLGLTLYRLTLLTVSTLALYATVASGPGFLLGFLVTSIIGWVYADDIKATISDLWNANFWVWRVK